MSGIEFKSDDDGLPGDSRSMVYTEERNNHGSKGIKASQNSALQPVQPTFNVNEVKFQKERRIANEMFVRKVRMEAKMKPLYHFIRGDFAKIPLGQQVHAYDAEKKEAVMLKNCGKLLDSEEFVFEETRLLTKIPPHKNIILLKAIATDSTNVYAVLESAKKNFQDVMETMKLDGKRFDTNDVKEIMKQLLQGVGHLHTHRVVHRNLRPSTILIGTDGILKISEFGYARDMIAPWNSPTILQDFHIPGHMQYAAQEEIRHNLYCHTGDMWSIGCILAELLVLEPLFQPGNRDFMKYQLFRMIGIPAWTQVPHGQNLNSSALLRQRFLDTELLTEFGFELLCGLLCTDAMHRLQAKDALSHPWFSEVPMVEGSVDNLAVNLNDIKLRDIRDELGEVYFLYQIEVESLDGTKWE